MLFRSGEVSYFKVMSGTLNAGADLTNMNKGNRERLAQIYCVCGQIKTPVDKLMAGDIGATVKMKDVKTGNTLNDKGCEYVFDFIKYPEPKYSRAIKPQNEPDAEKLSEILTRMHGEDPTWVIEQSKELKQTIVKGQGEFHLRTLKWRIENNEKLNVNMNSWVEDNQTEDNAYRTWETDKETGKPVLKAKEEIGRAHV